ncbi:hypothetical protein [Herbidospora yilanensis]|uniref:hypothetical protein n=1 Tax=Herbidospora yilanensis TaxID=354426 RepID=UPI0012F817A4|nr:hypothetical protein [Herbidospora yilanensis]
MSSGDLFGRWGMWWRSLIGIAADIARPGATTGAVVRVPVIPGVMELVALQLGFEHGLIRIATSEE